MKDKARIIIKLIPEERIWATRTRRLRRAMKNIVNQDRSKLGNQFNRARADIKERAEMCKQIPAREPRG